MSRSSERACKELEKYLAEHGFRHALRQAAAKLPHIAPVQADEPVFQRGVMIRIPHHADPGLIPFLEAGAQGHVHIKIKALHQLGQELPRVKQAVRRRGVQPEPGMQQRVPLRVRVGLPLPL